MQLEKEQKPNIPITPCKKSKTKQKCLQKKKNPHMRSTWPGASLCSFPEWGKSWVSQQGISSLYNKEENFSVGRNTNTDSIRCLASCRRREIWLPQNIGCSTASYSWASCASNCLFHWTKLLIKPSGATAAKAGSLSTATLTCEQRKCLLGLRGTEDLMNSADETFFLACASHRPN